MKIYIIDDSPEKVMVIKALLLNIGPERGIKINPEDILTIGSFQALESRLGEINVQDSVFLLDEVFIGKADYARKIDERQGRLIYNTLKDLDPASEDRTYGISSEFDQAYIKNGNITRQKMQGGPGGPFDYIFIILEKVAEHFPESRETGRELRDNDEEYLGGIK